MTPLLLGTFLVPFNLVGPYSGVSYGAAMVTIGAALVLLLRRPAELLSRVRANAFLLFSFVAVLGVGLSGLLTPESSTLATWQLIIQYACVFGLIPVAIIRLKPEERLRVLKAFVAGFVVSVIIGSIVVFAEPTLEVRLTSLGVMETFGDGREGLFAGVGELPKMAGMTACASFLLYSRRSIGVIFSGTVAIAVILAEVLARSTSGIVAAVAPMLIIAVAAIVRRTSTSESVSNPRSSKSWVFVLVGAATLALVALTVINGPFLKALIGRIFQPLTTSGVENVGSARLRLSLLNDAWSMIGAHPFLGTGPGAYDQYSQLGTEVHVAPIAMWAETGALVFFAFVFWWFALGVANLQRDGSRTVERTSSVAAFACLTVIAVSVPYIYPQVWMLPFTIIYLLDAPLSPTSSVRPHSS